MAGKTKFPKTVYVAYANSGSAYDNEEYLVVVTDINALDEGPVAVYKLVEERELVVSRELVKP